MKVVVTGGAGFIGSHIVDSYVAAGHEVLVVDNLSTGARKNVHQQAQLYTLDILDPSLPKVFSEFSPEVLSHHAAQVDLRLSVEDPIMDARINILGIVHVLEACKKARVKRVIFASSGGALYGEQETFPAGESHPTRPESPYGVAKLTGEYFLSYYQKVLGIQYVAFRYSNVYGPRQSALGEAGVVAIFVDRLLQGKTATINGDGKQTRDYVYVSDVLQANLLALETSFSGALNIATGVETDLETLFALLREQIDSNARVTYGPRKLGDVARSCLDSSRARELLGWSPRMALDAGLDETIRYYRRSRAS